MKPLLYLLIVLCTLLAPHSFSQDIISLKNGSTLNVKVMEIGTEEIKYKKSTNPNGPSYSIRKGTIDKITYPNGEEEIFSKEYLDKIDALLKKFEDAATNKQGFKALKSVGFKSQHLAEHDSPFKSSIDTSSLASDFSAQGRIKTTPKMDSIIRAIKDNVKEGATFKTKTENEEYYIGGYGYYSFSSHMNWKSVKSKDAVWRLSGSEDNGFQIQHNYDPLFKQDIAPVVEHFICFELLYEDKKNITYRGIEVNNGKNFHHFVIKKEYIGQYRYNEFWLDATTFLPVTYTIGSIKEGEPNHIVKVESSVFVKGFWFPTIESSILPTIPGSKSNRHLNTDFKVNEDFLHYFKVPDVNKLNASLENKKEIPISIFLELNSGDDLEKIIDLFKKNNIKYDNDKINKLSNEIDFVIIGSGEMNTIKIKEILDVSYDRIEFGFEKRKLKSIAFINNIGTDASSFISDRKYHDKFTNTTVSIDSYLSEKNGSKAEKSSYWDLPKGYKWDKIIKKKKEYNKINTNLGFITLTIIRRNEAWYQHLVLGDIKIAYKSESIFF